MRLSTRFRLISSFLAMCLLVGGLSLLAGSRLLTDAVLSEATNRVRQDLNVARELYRTAELRVRTALGIAAREETVTGGLASRDVARLGRALAALASEAELDFAGVVTPGKLTLCRLGSGSGSDVPNPAALRVLDAKAAVSGTMVLDREALAADDPALAARARIELIPIARAAPRAQREETSGLSIVVGAPVFDGNTLVGALYGGILLNRNEQIVDRICDTVFRREVYRGRSIGTATILLDDLRVATNVRGADGARAVGTQVSAEVKKKVLDEGEPWIGRAFVVNDWYISAYEPIVDVTGRRVGILYVGVLEQKYTDLRRQAILVFAAITCAGLALAVVTGLFLAHIILKPVQELIEASRRVSAGDLSPRFGPVSTGEMGVLQKTFQEMLAALRERDRHQRVESELRLLQSEKQASLGRLAAGVAHEINNPLTGVLTFTHMLLKRTDLQNDVRNDLATIAEATERVRGIVKGLLDFSRQTRLESEPVDVNALVSATIPLVANQALVKGVTFRFDPGEGLPELVLDRNEFQSVLLNIMMNAIDATDRGGHVAVSTRLSYSAAPTSGKGIEIAIADTGCGIPPEHLDKLFDPFFTTKEVGKGTGLGLSVSQGIVAHHGGTIRVQSKVGEGSTFIIWLPLTGGGA